MPRSRMNAKAAAGAARPPTATALGVRRRRRRFAFRSGRDPADAPDLEQTPRCQLSSPYRAEKRQEQRQRRRGLAPLPRGGAGRDPASPNGWLRRMATRPAGAPGWLVFRPFRALLPTAWVGGRRSIRFARSREAARPTRTATALAGRARPTWRGLVTDGNGLAGRQPTLRDWLCSLTEAARPACYRSLTVATRYRSYRSLTVAARFGRTVAINPAGSRILHAGRFQLVLCSAGSTIRFGGFGSCNWATCT